MRCPHCKKVVTPNIDRAVRNVVNYGSNSFVFRCTVCLCKYLLRFKRQVAIYTAPEPVTNEAIVDFD